MKTNKKLIKLLETHYIVVDDSEIKEGDFGLHNNKIYREKYFYIDEHIIVECTKSNKESIQEHWRKITYSTQPLEQYYGASDGSIPYVFHKIKSLHISEVEEAINGYSVEEMANEWSVNVNNVHPADSYIAKKGYLEGFNAHKKLTKDKLFTVDDIKNAFISGMEFISAEPKFYEKDANDFIQSLLSKTEWDIEFVNGKIKLL